MSRFMNEQSKFAILRQEATDWGDNFDTHQEGSGEGPERGDVVKTDQNYTNEVDLEVHVAPPLQEDMRGVESIVAEYEEVTHNAQLQKKLWEWYKTEYPDEPQGLFTEEGLTLLGDMSPAERMMLLGFASLSLSVTAEHVALYESKYPEDIQAIGTRFLQNSGSIKTVGDNRLYSLVLVVAGKQNPVIQEYPHFKKYKDISRRKIDAQHRLLAPDTDPTRFNRYGEGATGVKTVMHDILRTERMEAGICNPEQIFTKEFFALDTKDQVDLLRDMLLEVHTLKIWNEVYNSDFSERMVRDIELSIRNQQQYRNSFDYQDTHSVIYGSYQTKAAYDEGDERYDSLVRSDPKVATHVDEYSYERVIKKIVEALGTYDVETDKTVDLLVTMWKKTPHPLFIHEIAKTLSAVDSTRAASQLLPALQEATYERDRIPLSALLYRLEFGKIGINEHVVQYLEREYILPGVTEVFDHARRITVDGKIGLFDSAGNLLKYFDLGDLTQDQKKDVQLLEVTRSVLFADPNTPDTLRQSFLANYQKFYEDIFGEESVRMSDLTLREQVWMFKYHQDLEESIGYSSDQKKERWDKVMGLKQHVGVDGVRVFIAGEQDAGMGDKIISFSERSDIAQTDKEMLFHVYGSIVQELDRVEQRVSEFFVDGGTQDIDVRAVTKEIATRAYRILDTSMDAFGDGQIVKTREILQRIQRDIVQFSAIFKTVFKGKEQVDFDEIKGLSFEHTQELSDDDISDMQAIATMNYSTGSDFDAMVLHSLETTLKTPGTDYSILRREGKIISFISFAPYTDAKDTSTPQYLAGSFNVDMSYRGSSVGDAMIANTITIQAEKGVVHGYVHSEIGLAQRHMEKTGFVIDGVVDAGNAVGLKILLDKKRNPKFETKNKTFDEDAIMSLYEHSFANKDAHDLLHTTVGNAPQYAVLKFNFSNTEGKTQMSDTISLFVREGYAGTRYFADPHNESHVYCVFEKTDAVEYVDELDERIAA